MITDPGHVLHKHLPEARQINYNLRPRAHRFRIGYALRMTGTLFSGYFSRACINLLLFNLSVAQLYLGVLNPCIVGPIFDSLLLF